MAKRIYVDTNVYLDYLEARTDSFRPLDEFAFQLFKRTLSCEFEIVLSDLVMDELDKNKGLESIVAKNLFADLKKRNKLILVDSLPSEMREAKKFKEFRDVWHALIAKRMNCELIVTRNIEHFKEFSHLLQAILPENI